MERSRRQHRDALTRADADEEKVRLDKWLWVARFFKTRQLAAEAVAGGKVHLNGQRAKPGKDIAVGARLTVHKDQFEWDITVSALSLQRRPAKEAVLLYVETPESQAKRQALTALKREQKDLGALPDKRPDKRERRQIHRFKRSDS